MLSHLKVALIGLALVGGAVPTTAEAARYPRVAPQSCRALANAVGSGNVWHTRFYGERKGFFDEREAYSASPCFKSQQACVAWRYWAQSDWPYMNHASPCRRGI